MKTNKEKLFEMMEKINPELQNINEIVPPSSPPPSSTTNQQPRVPSDVQTLSRANQNASNVQRAGQRINTATEFPEAFRVWFSSLGYKPENQNISIMKVRTEIEKVMRSMGYK